jgi:hypothetical protein
MPPEVMFAEDFNTDSEHFEIPYNYCVQEKKPMVKINPLSLELELRL